MNDESHVVIAERADGRRVVFGAYPNEDAAAAMAARLRAVVGLASILPASLVADCAPGAELRPREERTP